MFVSFLYNYGYRKEVLLISNNAYMISYDLNSPGQDYEGMHSAIRDFEVCNSYMKYLDSTYLIISDLKAKDIFEHLDQFLDSSDDILIIEVNNHWYAKLPKDALKWLRDHLN